MTMNTPTAMRASTADTDLQQAGALLARYLERTGDDSAGFNIHWSVRLFDGEARERTAFVLVTAE